MVVRIRLARFGNRNNPFYRIYVADSRSPRDGKHLEVVGHYDPKPEIDGNKHLGVKIERIQYWLSVGAQPSDTVARLLGQAGIIPRAPRKGVEGAKLKHDAKGKSRGFSSGSGGFAASGLTPP